MKELHFNVLTEPWIPIITYNGKSKYVGIRECLINAHKIKKISDNVPYEKVAILRFLTAFACDAYRLKNKDARIDLFEQGYFNENNFMSYVEECQNKFGTSFDIFNKKRPFMSFPFDERYCSESNLLSATYLHLNLPSGGNAIHIHAQTEADFSGDTPASYFRALLSLYLYPSKNMMKGSDTATGINCFITDKGTYSNTYGSMGVNAGKSGSELVPVFYWPEKETLFATLIHCMSSERELGNLKLYDDNLTPWKTDKTPKSEFTKRGDVVTDISYVSGLTFQSRRVYPLIDDDGKIRKCYIANGYVNQNADLWTDPFAVKLIGDKGPYYPKPDISRACWMDIGNLIYSKDNAKLTRPSVLKPIDQDNKKLVNIYSFGFNPNSQGVPNALIYDDTLEIPQIFTGALNDDINEDECLELNDYLVQCIRMIESIIKCYKSIQSEQLKEQAKNYFLTSVHEFFIAQENSFLTEMVDMFISDRGGYKESLNKKFLSELDRIITRDCESWVKNACGWNKIKEAVNDITRFKKEYYKVTKKIRIPEKGEKDQE